ncbi:MULTISPECIES: hypothetical protein [unclassified Variovorax]|uniref:hypothetical protein n=1 Tax=unclassified Variovorax TaxID=663243 RepID=UPI001160542B|nr:MULTISPECIES: hypothetical protein [unclassified Variovorax]
MIAAELLPEVRHPSECRSGAASQFFALRAGALWHSSSDVVARLALRLFSDDVSILTQARSVAIAADVDEFSILR